MVTSDVGELGELGQIGDLPVGGVEEIVTAPSNFDEAVQYTQNSVVEGTYVDDSGTAVHPTDTDPVNVRFVIPGVCSTCMCVFVRPVCYVCVVCLVCVLCFVLPCAPSPCSALLAASYLRARPAVLSSATVIDVELFVSVDNGTTWLDADTPTGPVVQVNSTVVFMYVVTNPSELVLTNVTLTSGVLDLESSAGDLDSLEPGQVVKIFTEPPTDNVLGAYNNTATVTGTYVDDVGTVSEPQDSDSVHVFFAQPGVWDLSHARIGLRLFWHCSRLGFYSCSNLAQYIFFFFFVFVFDVHFYFLTAVAVHVFKASFVIPFFLPPSAGIDVELYVSPDNGTTWYDADTPTGPTLLKGTPVLLKYVVTNTLPVPLTSVVLSKPQQRRAGRNDVA